MKSTLAILLMAACALWIEDALTAENISRPQVETFVVLPADLKHPEGLAVDPDTGSIFFGTFDAHGSGKHRNALVRLTKTGQVSAIKEFGPTPLTGVAVRRGQLYALNFGSASLVRLPADFNADSKVETLVQFTALDPPAPPARRVDNPDGSQDETRYGSKGVPAPNGMTFSSRGDLFISDSFQGAIYRVPNAEKCRPCSVEVVSRSPLLATAGTLPFGANGLAFNADESWLYLTNAGDNLLLRMRPDTGVVEVLVENVPGADGLQFHRGLLWIAANQVDQIRGYDEAGLLRVVAGGFEGIDQQGAPIGLLFPSETAATAEGWMLVANLSLALSPQKGDEWEERISRWTLSRFQIPETSK